jgi:hypothetical protein
VVVVVVEIVVVFVERIGLARMVEGIKSVLGVGGQA